MNKIAIVAALAVALGAASTEAKFKINAHKITKGIKKATKVAQTAQQIGLLDEDEADWEFNAGLSGQVGQKPTYQVGISGKWDEEEEQKFKIGKALKTAAKVAVIASEAGLLEEDGIEEQKFKLGKALKKTAQVLVKANELGLLEEEAIETQGLGKTLKKAVKVAVVATELGLLDEEELLDAEQKLHLGKALKKVVKVAVIASEVGLLDEDEEEDEQKIKLGKALKKAVKVATTAQQLGLLEEADWNFNAGISGQVGSKPTYQVGIGAKWEEEEEEQKFKLGKALKKAAKVAVKANELGLLEEEEEEQKFKLGKALKKAVKVATTAQQLGLLDEDEADWNFNAGISGQVGSKPSYQVGIGAKWDEEQGFGTKLNNALNTIDHAVNTAHAIGVLEEEEEQGLKKALKNVTKVAIKASEAGLLDEDEEQKIGEKVNAVLDKIEAILRTVGRVKDIVNTIKNLEEDEIGFLGGEGSTWVNRPQQGANVWEEEEEQKFKLGKALKKAAKVAVKANELGLLDEEQAGFLGGEGSTWVNRPYAGSGVWEEEEEEQKFKLGKALKKAVKVATTAQQLGLLEEEEEEEQKFKLGKALKKAAKVAVKANELGLLEEEEQSFKYNPRIFTPTPAKFDDEEQIYDIMPVYPKIVKFDADEDEEQQIYDIMPVYPKIAKLDEDAEPIAELESYDVQALQITKDLIKKALENRK